MLTRELRDDERAALQAHLLALSDEDRRLRFGNALPDDAVAEYVRGIDLGRDVVFVVVDGAAPSIAGAAHLARGDGYAEVGLSVLESARGRGVGDALLERCIVRARNWGARGLFAACLTENQGMVRLGRKHGLRGEMAQGSARGSVALAAPTPHSMTSDLMSEQLAWLDLAHKQQWLAMRSWLGRDRETPKEIP